MRGIRIPRFATDPLQAAAAQMVRLMRGRLRPAAAALTGWPYPGRVRARMSRLPPAAALPLFLVPEACSRLGWLASAWLLLRGHAWQSLALYTATKLIAGCTALWIYSACEPALLRIPWFARCHATMVSLSGRLPPFLERAARSAQVAGLARAGGDAPAPPGHPR